MKNFKLKITSMLLILLLLASSLVPAYAAEARATASYSTEYNSGVRGVVCTSLDGTSAASYYANHDYDELSELSSGALFSSLQSLMRSTHDYTSSYDDCHYKANRTDCEGENGKVLLIYTSYSATMSQWNGWNREHVWPKSLGGDTTRGGGADLHHIRPSDAGVNSSRSNKKYGEVGDNASEKYGTSPAVGVLGGTYNSTYFEPLDNVKGDVARICLYVYTRWNSDWGASSINSVFQSVDVLLEWCELDPVDTWEMGRNEVVGAIQGNRNVFIDYPEYAWLLFGKDVPDDMTTPSGEAKGGNTDTPSQGGSGESGDSGNTDIETPVGESATLSFADDSNRTSFSTDKQVWEENGIKLTNDKASSTTNVANYSDPVRLYKGSSVTIEAPQNIAKIDFTCNSSTYATALANSISDNVSVNGNVVTVTLGTPDDSYTVSALSAQVRLNSLTVYYAKDAEPECHHMSATTTTVSPTCTATGSTTVVCDECGEQVSYVVIAALGHDYIDNACVRCGHIVENVSPEPTQGGWTLVTNESELKAGDKIVMVAKTFVAGNIGNSIMASVSGVSAADGSISALPDSAMILTLGGSTGAWTLADTSGKLLGATAVKKLAWDKGTTSWSISISGGNATIQNATASYGRFLYNSSSPRFTTYTSNTNASMLLPQIYKYVEASADEDAEIKSVSMTVGSDLTMNYYVTGYDQNTDYYMIFTMHGVDSDRIYGIEKNGYLVFSLTNIAPQFMGDGISAALYADDSEIPCSVLEDYSVKDYAEKIMETFAENETLMDLVADMLRYGASAQIYKDYKTDELVSDGLDLDAHGSDELPTEDDDDRYLDTPDEISALADSFTSAGVRFDFDNKIFFKFKTDDISKIKITVNGVTIDDLADKVVSVDGKYVFYTDGLLATEFDKTFTFTMYVNNVEHQTLTYSVNSYAYAKYEENTDIAGLVRALYRYGISAQAYAA